MTKAKSQLQIEDKAHNLHRIYHLRAHEKEVIAWGKKLVRMNDKNHLSLSLA